MEANDNNNLDGLELAENFAETSALGQECSEINGTIEKDKQQENIITTNEKITGCESVELVNNDNEDVGVVTIVELPAIVEENEAQRPKIVQETVKGSQKVKPRNGSKRSAKSSVRISILTL